MNILVTAGNTLTPIDQVRGITNIFTGRTGARIALCAQERGHRVTLLTSHPEVVAELRETLQTPAEGCSVRRYRTFDNLEAALAEEVTRPGLDAVIHAAAVSDYRTAGIYAPGPTTHFQPATSAWENTAPGPPTLIDMTAGKVKSTAPELWLRLLPTPKLIDRIRTEWNFAGILVKFKLEVGISDERLLEIAEQSRRLSHADLMTANTLEGAGYWALLGPLNGHYERISRRDLAPRLLTAIEQLHGERHHG